MSVYMVLCRYMVVRYALKQTSLSMVVSRKRIIILRLYNLTTVEKNVRGYILAENITADSIFADDVYFTRQYFRRQILQPTIF